MSVENVLIEALRFLSPKIWRLDELPEYVTDGVLRILDDRGYIELETYDDTEAGKERVVCAWFSPLQLPGMVGTWDFILRQYRWGHGKERNRGCNLRVSEKGETKLAEVKVAELAKGQPTKPKKPRKRAKRTELTKKQQAVVDLVETHNQTISEIARSWNRPPQAVHQLYQRARNNPAYKQRSVNLHKAKTLHANTQEKGNRSTDE